MSESGSSSGQPSSQTHAPGGFGPNEWLVEELYQQYLADKNSVDAAWWDFFQDFKPADSGPSGNGGSSPPRQRRTAHAGPGTRHPADRVGTRGGSDPAGRRRAHRGPGGPEAGRRPGQRAGQARHRQARLGQAGR